MKIMNFLPLLYQLWTDFGYWLIKILKLDEPTIEEALRDFKELGYIPDYKNPENDLSNLLNEHDEDFWSGYQGILTPKERDAIKYTTLDLTEKEWKKRLKGENY